MVSDLFDVESIKAELNIPKTFLNPEAKAKELLKEVNWVIAQRKTEYIDDFFKLLEHSSVQIRRKVVEGLGVIANKDCIDLIKEYQSKESDRKTWLMIEVLIDKLTRSSSVELDKSVKVLNVGEALFLIRQTIGSKNYIIEGELGQVNHAQNGRITYFTIKDKEDVSLSVLATESVLSRINFPLNEGLSIRINGYFRISNRSGKLYFEAKKIELTGEGELLRNLKLLEEKLSKEGLFDQDRKREIPIIPKNILLIASPASAAVADFKKVLNQRRKGLTIFHLPIKTQGIGSEREILDSLSRVNSLINSHGIDTIVITRGGGSKEDLFVFNSENVVRAIYSLNKPTIVAIGHERDNTLAEFVADMRCSTPSQAAEKVSLSAQEVSDKVKNICNLIVDKNTSKIREYNDIANQIRSNINYLIKQQIDQYRSTCYRVNSFISNLISNLKQQTLKFYHRIINSTKASLFEVSRSFVSLPNYAENLRSRVNQTKIESIDTTKRLSIITEKQINLFKSQFFPTFQKIELTDPKYVLDRGYAMVFLKDVDKKNNWSLINKISQVDTTQPELKIKMQHGEIVTFLKRND